MSPQKYVLLTDSGLTAATAIMRKHRLAERLLVDVIGLDWEAAHGEASRWQHVLGDVVERRLLALLDDPTSSPYGNPIPALDRLDPSWAPVNIGGARPDSLADLARLERRQVRVCRILEPLQRDLAALHELWTAGIVPGTVIGVVATGRPDAAVRLDSAAGTTIVSGAAARWIVAVESPDQAPPGGSSGGGA